jgi:hypothetical protein
MDKGAPIDPVIEEVAAELVREIEAEWAPVRRRETAEPEAPEREGAE